jgi:hypothetical protein
MQSGGIMNKRSLITLVMGAALVMAIPMFAHHGSAAFDTAKPVTVKGTVTEWFWANPHCFLKFDSKEEDGSVRHWAAEVSNPPDMTQRGWNHQSFKPGDEVTVTLIRAKNGTPVGRAQKIVLPDGRVFTAMEGTGAFPATPADAPKSSDEQKSK